MSIPTPLARPGSGKRASGNVQGGRGKGWLTQINWPATPCVKRGREKSMGPRGHFEERPTVGKQAGAVTRGETNSVGMEELRMN